MKPKVHMECKYNTATPVMSDLQIMCLWMTPKIKAKTFHTVESMCTTKMVERKNE